MHNSLAGMAGAVGSIITVGIATDAKAVIPRSTFGVEFEDGTNGKFSLDKALSAVAN
jgi:hypothetical protein